MDVLFGWMKLEREGAPEEVLAPAHEEADLAAPEGEVDMVETEGMETGVMVTEALVVETGALVAVDTGVEDIPQAATGKTGGRVDMVSVQDLDPTAMDTTAMLHMSKHLPDSRSSLGWLFFKDALLKKNVHVFADLSSVVLL